MLEDCAGVAALLSDPVVTAAADCIEAGGPPLRCLASSTAAVAPTAAHRSFASKFCSDCLLGLPGCEEAFFSDGTGDAGIAGALILPFGDALVEGITAECAGGLSCATFPSCAQGVLLQQALPEATAACLIDSLSASLSGADDDAASAASGDCSLAGTNSGGDGGDASHAGGATGTGTVTASCGSQQVAASCAPCARENCCAELLACDAGTPCGNLNDCVAACGDEPACRDACEGTYAAGKEARNTLLTCVAGRCTAPQLCDGGGVCNYFASFDQGGACDSCIESFCCAEVNACLGSDAEACGDCIDGVGTCTSAGYAVLGCFAENCELECGF
jgi:hypothetical protein